MSVSRINATDPRQVVVVDPRLDDYLVLAPVEGERPIRFLITSTGASALRLATSHADALWVIGRQLPDVGGLELLEMLRSLIPDATTILLDDQYCEQTDQRARILGVDQYLSKPFQIHWLNCWSGPQRPVLAPHDQSVPAFHSLNPLNTKLSPTPFRSHHNRSP